MSMTMLTILQITGVSAAYLGVTLLLPWLFLRRKLTQFRISARFMAYCLVGNFYCINLVFLLQLLHISNRATLIAGTLVPVLVVAVKYRRRLLELIERTTDVIGSFSEGEIGTRTVALRMKTKMQRFAPGWLARWLAPRWLDLLLAVGVVVLVLVMYGVNTVSTYGYCSSDLLVHNYWINSMEQNRIFVDGVYPFGFHCVIYYLHAVFAIPIYVLLRVFALTQTVMVHLMLLAFLKLVCKSKYTPYAGMAAYILSGVFYRDAYYRYYAPLPQGYGMLFILPAAWFAIAFLLDMDFVSSDKKKWWSGGAARYYLILFAISVSLTLATHFYDTIVTGLLCVGIGVGFCVKCLRWRYLKRLLMAGMAGLLIGVLPMAVACALGTSLHGSLQWGVDMVSAADVGSGAVQAADSANAAAGASSGIMGSLVWAMNYQVTSTSNRAGAIFILCSVGVLLALGISCFVMRRHDYGGVLASFGVFTALMCVLQAAPWLGTPSLMEASRYAMYIGYALAVAWSLSVDAAAYLLFKEWRTINIAGLVGLGAVCVAVALTGVRLPDCISGYEPNGAMVCLTNILRENRDSTSWTICSANDERQMISGRGYHYETITFLRDQEELTEDTSLTIPTDTVYFFIEKVPLLYHDYMNTIRPEREVSPEGAELPLSKGGGIVPYMEDARWVTMSRMYYWAQAFQKLYPYEMEVYYETDDFVCYRVRQDGYNLYNFAIDYGYNV